MIVGFCSDMELYCEYEDWCIEKVNKVMQRAIDKGATEFVFPFTDWFEKEMQQLSPIPTTLIRKIHGERDKPTKIAGCMFNANDEWIGAYADSLVIFSNGERNTRLDTIRKNCKGWTLEINYITKEEEWR